MKRMILSTVLFACICTMSPGDTANDDMTQLMNLALPPVKQKPWIFKEFPILAWWAPPGTANFSDFKMYKEAGFTLYPANPDTGYERSIELAKQAGLKILAFRTMQGFGLPAKDIDHIENDNDIVGFITHDEPGAPVAVIQSVRETNALMLKHPSKRTFYNFLPSQAQPEPGTRKVAEIALRNGLPILSYDNYVVLNDGATLEEQHFENLELFRSLSVEHDVPFWAFALTIKHGHYRRPSESDIRWKQFTNLAYGAKGLWYFTYWGPTDWDGWDNKAIVNPKDGSTTEIYEYVKKINHAVLDIDDILLGLKSIDVVHTHPTKGCRPFKNDRYIAELVAKKVLIGYFTDTKGLEYVMVVNCLHGAGKTAAETADEIRMRFTPDVKVVEALSWLDGNTGPLKLTDGWAKMTLAGGTGVLLRITRQQLPSQQIEYKKM